MGHRGRPRSANARRRATTRAGRAPPPDYGSPQLLAHRKALSGRTDLPANPLDTLFGRGLIDEPGYRAGIGYAALTAIVRRGLGPSQASVAALWERVIAGNVTDVGTRRPEWGTGGESDALNRVRLALDRRRRALEAAGLSVLYVTNCICIDRNWPAWLKRIVLGRPGERGDFLFLNDLKFGLWTLVEHGRRCQEARPVDLAAE